MRRCIAILLLALLPFQLGWAAVSAYCGHESGAQAQHLGHHEHQHQGQDGPGADVPDASAPAGFDFDCGHCHVPCAAMPTMLAALAVQATVAHPARPADAALQTRAASPPERPQWRRLA